MKRDYRGVSQTIIGGVAGVLRLGTIISFDPETLEVRVYIGTLKEFGNITLDYINIVRTQLPLNAFSPKGMFVGSYPENGTPVLVIQADAGQWYIVQILARNIAALNTTGPSTPNLSLGTYHIQANDNTFIKLNKIDGITLGENDNSLILDTDRDILSNTFDNIYKFSEASREIEGIIKRDVFPNENYASSLREKSLDYNDTIKTIGFDPIAKEAWSNMGSSIRNPSRTEKRETIYEYARSFNIASDDVEFKSYKDNKNINIKDIINRREGRADALSLSLVSPNYLMETIKGTVVDLYGNILDLNRNIIPLGKIDKLSIKNVKTNLEDGAPLGNVFQRMKALERKGIAYHFEINSKKDTIGPPDTTSRDDYARTRSRFAVDIDKEGVLKLNVPASSEVGNIPLLTRYENYSTIFPNDDTKDPNDLTFNQNAQDILLESFIGNNGVVRILDELNGDAAPQDRFGTQDKPIYIKHGTVYHNISNTLTTFAENVSTPEVIPTTFMGRDLIIPKKNIITSTVQIAGDNANAGGRSMLANFDGQVELNIGANSLNRHSLWADLQGAMIMNVGRDNTDNNISAALHFDGEVLIESGGKTPNNDSRFVEVNNDHKAGCVDIRVYDSVGNIQIVRIDNTGINIHSESRINIYSNADLTMRSMGTVIIDGEQVIINSRTVRKELGIGPI